MTVFIKICFDRNTEKEYPGFRFSVREFPFSATDTDREAGTVSSTIKLFLSTKTEFEQLCYQR
jgi:hypothetical protein